eukprot:scaffold872_cov421-Prasinococcus_capsulatus_cf.AAC.10
MSYLAHLLRRETEIVGVSATQKAALGRTGVEMALYKEDVPCGGVADAGEASHIPSYVASVVSSEKGLLSSAADP